ncbi:MAG TPA: S1 RNA-binding domain-containing protein, partial [Planctomycetota bacterium]|nr:S1 RNA-binding domain-containing protein [Planctomycetota bacterium]
MSRIQARQLVKKLGISREEEERQLEIAMGNQGNLQQEEATEAATVAFKPDTIVKGRIAKVVGDSVVVDIRYKSEGLIPLEEWGDVKPVVGDEIEVYLEGLDDEEGMLELSKRRADRIHGWERIIAIHKEGEVIK